MKIKVNYLLYCYKIEKLFLLRNYWLFVTQQKQKVFLSVIHTISKLFSLFCDDSDVCFICFYEVLKQCFTPLTWSGLNFRNISLKFFQFITKCLGSKFCFIYVPLLFCLKLQVRLMVKLMVKVMQKRLLKYRQRIHLRLQQVHQVAHLL